MTVIMICVSLTKVFLTSKSLDPVCEKTLLVYLRENNNRIKSEIDFANRNTKLNLAIQMHVCNIIPKYCCFLLGNGMHLWRHSHNNESKSYVTLLSV